MDETFFRFQIHAFGAAAGGDILDFTTMLCEDPTAECVQRRRDRTREEMKKQHSVGYVPARWALPAARVLEAL